MLIWIASYPRSGNRYFRMICAKRYDMPQRDKYIPPKMDHPHYEQVISLDAIVASEKPALVKTHDLPQTDTHQAIYLLRDGRDALVSYAHYALVVFRNVEPEAITPSMFHETLRNLILDDRSEFGSWSQNVSAWTRRPNTVVVRYEDVVRDPAGTTDRALAAAGCQLPRVCDELPTFESMKQKNSKVVRRGVIGSWRDEFPADLLPLFWKRHGATMQECGYSDHRSNAA
jgi:sulfotransferase family protein